MGSMMRRKSMVAALSVLWLCIVLVNILVQDWMALLIWLIGTPTVVGGTLMVRWRNKARQGTAR